LLGQLFAVDQPFRLRIGADAAGGQKHLSSKIFIAALRPAGGLVTPRACCCCRAAAAQRTLWCAALALRHELYPVAFSYG
jgi:hypothetical protein